MGHPLQILSCQAKGASSKCTPYASRFGPVAIIGYRWSEETARELGRSHRNSKCDSGSRGIPRVPLRSRLAQGPLLLSWRCDYLCCYFSFEVNMENWKTIKSFEEYEV